MKEHKTHRFTTETELFRLKPLVEEALVSPEFGVKKLTPFKKGQSDLTVLGKYIRTYGATDLTMSHVRGFRIRNYGTSIANTPKVKPSVTPVPEVNVEDISPSLTLKLLTVMSAELAGLKQRVEQMHTDYFRHSPPTAAASSTELATGNGSLANGQGH